jgi:hypothetical protein
VPADTMFKFSLSASNVLALRSEALAPCSARDTLPKLG